VRRALERYNGSVGHRDYPDRVIVRWTTYWNGADDSGTPGGQAVLKSLRQLLDTPARALRSSTSLTFAAAGPIQSQAMNSATAPWSPAGQHLDPAIRQIARMAGDTGSAGALRGAGAIVDALHAPEIRQRPRDAQSVAHAGFPDRSAHSRSA
jgi:hypothetical protein